MKICGRSKLSGEVENDIVNIFDTYIRQKKAPYFAEFKKIVEMTNAIPNEKTREEHLKAEKAKLDKKYNFDYVAVEKELKYFTHGMKPRNFFPWQLYFADVFKKKGGFDVVIGNPPYVDSENMVKNNPALRDRLSQIYSTTKGNWDLYVPFFELSHIILKPSGILSFITPNKWLSINYGKELRKYIHNDLYLVCNCSKIKVFEAGNSPVITYIRKCNSSKLLEIAEFSETWGITNLGAPNNELLNMENWGVLLSENITLLLKLLKNKDRVSNYAKVENPFSTSEAYELCRYVIDNESGDGCFKLINTGTIDPYTSRWGHKTTSYLKGKYRNPVINKVDFKRGFPRRYEQSISNKIIITGMRYFECYHDEKGDYIAGKSTIIIRNFIGEINPKALLAILNSKLISFYIKQSYSALGIDGGINFSTDIVESLPLPSNIKQQELVAFTSRIEAIKKTNPAYDTSEIESEIDALVYALYNLTNEEIAVVEARS